MMAGHFTMGMIAHQHSKKNTLLFFLVLSQFQDLLWFIFHYFNLEVTGPKDVLNGTIENMSVNMMYSHDLLPQALWLLVVFLIGKYLFKSTKVGFLSLLIVISHFILDFFSGHPHYVFGPSSHEFGLGLYKSNVILAIGIEAVFCLISLMYFFKKERELKIERTNKNKLSIVGVFAFGVIFMLTIAKVSFRDLFNIPVFDLGINTNVPALIITYLTLIACLNYFLSHFKVKN